MKTAARDESQNQQKSFRGLASQQFVFRGSEEREPNGRQAGPGSGPVPGGKQRDPQRDRIAGESFAGRLAPTVSAPWSGSIHVRCSTNSNGSCGCCSGPKKLLREKARQPRGDDTEEYPPSDQPAASARSVHAAWALTPPQMERASPRTGPAARIWRSGVSYLRTEGESFRAANLPLRFVAHRPGCRRGRQLCQA
jgi:hypothetical protein